MSQDLDRLIDKAFEHDRERLPKAGTSAPLSLMKKAAVPAAATSSGLLAAVWVKALLGLVAVGGIASYFALRGPDVPSASDQLTPRPSPSSAVEPAIDSPVVRLDTSMHSQSSSKSRPAGFERAPGTSNAQRKPLHLMPPILDSGVKLRDSTIRPVNPRR
jgi:hypothetical protein